ncbi:hypothetical protein [Flavobacterium mesophilum]|uniref:hypothetical protein n=1 Tax=Flavobacterium mesophilum TaxID=3143495 RepID=UPI0031DB882B
MKILDLFKNLNFIKAKNKEVVSIEEVVTESSVDDNIEYSPEERERNFYFEKFETFDKNRIIQDNLELNGEGTCIMISGSDRYGHVKFRLYSSVKDNSEIVWSVNEKELPKAYRDGVDKVANLFIDFIEKERGDLKKFIFEIVDTSYHPVDARLVAYEVATFRAIQNSFDEKLHKPNLRLIRREIKKEEVVKIKRKSNFKL